LAGYWTGQDIEARRRAGVLDDHAYWLERKNREGEKQKALDLLFRLGLLPAHMPRTCDQIPELNGDLHNAVIGFLALTPCQLLVVNQEDLTKETAQQNLPGTTWQYPNWARKMRYTVEELTSHSVARDYTAMFRNWMHRTDRINRQVQ
jgi:4-alpha-glucanotransferase